MLRPYEAIARAIGASISKDARLIFLEEGILSGGASENILRRLKKAHGFTNEYKILAIDDDFCHSQKGKSIYEVAGISKNDILANLR